jgi:hypothetical protein
MAIQYDMALSSVRTELDELVIRSGNASAFTTGILPDAVFPENLSIAGNVTANLIYANMEGEVIFVGGLSVDDIIVAGTSVVDEIQAIKNTDLSSFAVQDGSAAAPSLAFQSDRNTGLFRPANDTVALAAGGVMALSANATTVTVPGTVSATHVLVNGESVTTLTTDTWLQSSDGEDRVYYSSNGSTLFHGNVHAPIFIGDGRYLSNVASSNASTLIDGTLSNNVLPQDIIISGNITANTISGNLDVSNHTIDGELILLDGHLNTTTISADDITLAGTSLVADIEALKNMDLTSVAVQDGTVTVPSLSFQSDRNTGLFRPANDTVALAAGGVMALSANATTVTVPGTLAASEVLINGAEAATLQTDTWHQSTDGQDRVYYTSNGNTRFAGNVEAARFIGDGQFLSNVASSNASTLTTGTLENARLPQDITISGNITANTVHANIDFSQQTVDGELVLLDGHLTTTTLSADDITLAGESLVAEIQAIKNTDLSSFTVQDGTVTAPSLAFQTDRNTGLFRPSGDTVALAAGGVTALSANATTTVVPGTLAASEVLINGAEAATLQTDTWHQSTDGQDRVYYTSNGNTQFAGNVEAARFIGDGQFLSNVASSNASTLTTGTVNADRLPATVFRSGAAVAGDLRFTDTNGRGIKFWDSEQFKIYMSAVDDETWGGRMDSTSDFNMYFRMADNPPTGTNRGFVFQSNQSNVAHIDGGGNLYIAGTLEASGEVTSYASDARLKTNINPIQDPLTIIEHLDGYTFQWRSDVEGLPMAGKKDIGLIVQDIDKAGLSEECTAPAPFDNTYKTIHYNKIHAISVASIKKLHQRINTLEQKVEFLLSKV